MNLKQILQRIEDRLSALGMSASAASKKAGKPDAIRNLKRAVESGGGRQGISTETLFKLAEVLETTPTYLIEGIHESEGNRSTARSITSPILEVDVRAGAGGGGVPVEYWEADAAGNNIPVEGIRSEWHLPPEITGQLLKAQPQHLRIFEVVGDSMEPRLHEGDRVFIDTRYRFPSPEGIFALWDGYGVVIKRLEIVRGSDPLRYRIISANESYTTYEATEDEARIIGRYAGRFTAF